MLAYSLMFKDMADGELTDFYRFKENGSEVWKCVYLKAHYIFMKNS
jgi:hypothetical protein